MLKSQVPDFYSKILLGFYMSCFSKKSSSLSVACDQSLFRILVILHTANILHFLLPTLPSNSISTIAYRDLVSDINLETAFTIISLLVDL